MPAPVIHRYQPHGAARTLFEYRGPEVLLSGPAGCVAGETELWDPLAKRGRRIDKLHQLNERPWVQTLAGPILAEVPFLKGVADLYRVRLADGQSCVVTADHMFLSAAGWSRVADLAPGSGVLCGLPAGVHHCSETGVDSLADYLSCSGSCDPLLPRGSVVGLFSEPSQSDALAHNRDSSPQSVLASRVERNRFYQLFGHRSMPGSLVQRLVEPLGAIQSRVLAIMAAVCQSVSGRLAPDSWSFLPLHQSHRALRLLQPLRLLSHVVSRMPRLSCAVAMLIGLLLGSEPRVQSGAVEHAARLCQPSRRSWAVSLLAGLSRGSACGDAHMQDVDQRVYGGPSCSHYRSHWVAVANICYERTDFYYDLHVPGEEHYLADGMWSHNSGKSMACLFKIHMIALRNPGMRGLIVRKTLASLGSTGLVTFREHVLTESLRAGVVSFYGGSSQEAAAYRYSNGSVIVVGGLDRPTRIMSSDYDICFIQEATELQEDDWELLTTRLRNHRVGFQQLLADCNPSTPTHWLKKRCDRGATLMLESRHEDNPILFRDGAMTERGRDYMSRLDALSGVRYLRLRKGIWAAAEGMIFEDWDPAVHLIDRFEIPDSWIRHWVCDFGFTNPFVLQRWAIDPDGRAYRYGEQYMTRRLVEDHARTVLNIVTNANGRWAEPRPQTVICDTDAEDRATLERHLGLSTIAATKAVDGGIQAVAARLKVAGDSRPRMFLLRDSLHERDQELVDAGKPTCTEEEIPGYVWAEPSGASKIRERPRKVDDHGADCLRYLCAELDGGTRPRVRWL